MQQRLVLNHGHPVSDPSLPGRFRSLPLQERGKRLGSHLSVSNQRNQERIHTNSRTHNMSQGSSPDLDVQLTLQIRKVLYRLPKMRGALSEVLPLCDLETGPASFDSMDSEENQVSDIRTSYSCLIEPNYTPMVAVVAITGYQFISQETAMTEISIEFAHGFQS